MAYSAVHRVLDMLKDYIELVWGAASEVVGSEYTAEQRHALRNRIVAVIQVLEWMVVYEMEFLWLHEAENLQWLTQLILRPLLA